MKKHLLLVALLLAGCAGTPETLPSPVPNTPTLSPTETAVPVTSTLEPSPIVIPDTVTPSAPFSALPEVDQDRIGVIGASIGANMAMKLGETQEQLKTLILLSPGLDYFGVFTQSALSGYGDRPVMIVASREDIYSAESSETLAAEAKGDVNLVIFEGLGHGTGMFSQEPDLLNDMIEWLDQYL